MKTDNASAAVTERIQALGDWRGETLAYPLADMLADPLVP